MAIRTVSSSKLNPNSFYQPAWSSALGGIVKGATGVANQYLDKRNSIDKWVKLGFPQDAAETIAMLPADAQAQIIDQYIQNPEGVLQQSNRIGAARAQQAQGLNQAPQRQGGQILPTQEMQQSSPMRQLQPQQQQAQNQAPQQQQPQMQAPRPVDLLSASAQGRNVEIPQPQQARSANQLAALTRQPATAPGTEPILQGLNNAIAGSPQSIQAPQTAAQRPPAIPQTPRPAFGGFSKGAVKQTTPYQEAQLLDKQQARLEKHEEKEQARIDKKNAPWVKAHEKRMETTREIIPVLDQLKADWESGKVASGAAGKFQATYTPWALNEESARFMQNGQKLQAAILSMPQFGQTTNAKLKFTEALKTALSQPHAAQGSTIDNIYKEVNSNFDLDKIYQETIDENGGKEPENLGLVVTRKFNELHPSNGRTPKETVAPEKKSLTSSSNQDESLLSQAGRFGARTAARVAETAVGAPGDILSAGAALTKYATGGKTPSYEEIQKKLPVSLPTSQQTKEWISGISGGITDPQGPYEKILDSVIDTAASFIVPGKGIAAAGKVAGKLAGTAPKVAKAIETGAKLAFPFSGTDSWKSALTKGAASEAAGGIISGLGGGSGSQAVGKIALLTAMGSKGTRKTLDDTMKAAYDASQKAGKESPKITTRQLHKAVSEMKHGIGTRLGPEKATVNEIVSDAEKVLGKKTPITINDLVDVKKKLNEWIGLGYKPKVTGEKYLPKAARTEVQKLNRLVTEGINKYALAHPEFGKPYAIAEELYKGLHAFDNYKNIIKKAHPLLQQGGGASAAIYAIFHPAKAAGVAAAGASGLYAGEFAALLMKSPHARQIYAHALKNAAEGNIQAFAKDASRLDKEMES